MKQSKKLFLYFLFLSIVLLTGFEQTNPERYIVIFKDEINESLLLDYHGEIHEEIPAINAIVVDLPRNSANTLLNNAAIESVEIDTQVQIDNRKLTSWGINHIEAPTSWSLGLTGNGIKVAVIDTGVSPHSNLVIRDGISTVAYTSSYADDNGHGTHAAGIIAGRNLNNRIIGVAPNVELYAIKALNSEGVGNVSDLVNGIQWAIDQKIDIINLSLGTDKPSKALATILEAAYNKNILIVASTGNVGDELGEADNVQYPAKYPTVIAVAAVDNQNKRADFSATGDTVEVAAPGVDILSTSNGGGYVYMSGTSMAAPFVSGNLALLKELYPNDDNETLREMLHATAINIGQPTWYGYGLVQAPDQLLINSSVPKEPVGLIANVDYNYSDTPAVFLEWAKSESLGEIKEYRIFRNGYHLYTVDASFTSFVDFVPIPGKYTYQVSAISTSEIQSLKSDPLIIQVENPLLKSFIPDQYFNDISKEHWAANHIYYLVSEKIIKGYTDGSFKDNNKVTRGQVAIMIGLALGLDGTNRETVFTDVDEEYFASGYIQAAFDAGVIRGYTDGSFKPDDPITRGHIAIMIDNAFGLEEVPISPFSDVTETTPGYASINKLSYYHIAKGYDDGTYKPSAHTTRAQFSILMTNTLLLNHFLKQANVQ